MTIKRTIELQIKNIQMTPFYKIALGAVLLLILTQCTVQDKISQQTDKVVKKVVLDATDQKVEAFEYFLFEVQ